MLKHIARHSGYLAFSAALVKVVYFVWSAYIARALGVDLFGQFNYFAAFTVIFTSLPDLGMGLILIRQLSRDFSANLNQWFHYRYFNLILSLLSIPLILLLFTFSNPGSPFLYPVFLAALLFAASSLRSPYVVLLQAKEKFQSLAIFELINVTTPVLFSFIAVSLAPSVTHLFYGQILGMAFSLLALYLYTTRLFPQKVPAFRLSHLKPLLRVALPLGAAAFFGMLTAKIDQLFIARLLSTSQLGIFAVANSIISGLIGVFANTFALVTLPMLAHRSNRSAVIQIGLLAAAVSLGLAAGVYFFSPFLIHLAFGSQYLESIRLAQIMGFSLIFLMTNRLFEQVLLVKHHEYLYLFINLVGATVTIITNWLLIQHFGTIGAAWSKIISQLTLFLITGLILYFLARQLPIKTAKSHAKSSR